MESIDKKEYIECECGTHILQVTYLLDVVDREEVAGTDQIKTYFYESFQLAVFGYGKQTDKVFKRIIIGLKYIWTGKMFADQITLEPKEANKLINFINDN